MADKDGVRHGHVPIAATTILEFANSLDVGFPAVKNVVRHTSTTGRPRDSGATSTNNEVAKANPTWLISSTSLENHGIRGRSAP